MNRRNPLKNRKGVSMVELIVTFALIALFMGLFSQVFVTAMGAYQDIKSLDYGKQVCDTIMDKIVSELSEAQMAAGIAGGTVHMTIKKGKDAWDQNAPDVDSDGVRDYDAVEFYDKYGTHAKICVGTPRTYTYGADPISGDYGDIPSLYASNNPVNWGPQLIVHYNSITVGTGAAAQVSYEAVDWVFDKKMYQGFQIKSLHFSRADETGVDYPKQILKVELELTSDRYGLYKTTRYVDCYNFTDKFSGDDPIKVES